jgi:formylglycine-generating enzyme required for sulfatase activity
LVKEGEAHVEVGLGRHLIAATSSDGRLLWTKSIEIEKPKNEHVALRLVRDSPPIDDNGLMWAKRDNDRAVTWTEAVAYCRNLRVGPYSDWRLPSAADFLGILNKDKGLRCYDPYTQRDICGFNQVATRIMTPQGRVWTTSNDPETGQHFTVSFGAFGTGPAGARKNRALCVRDSRPTQPKTPPLAGRPGAKP